MCMHFSCAYVCIMAILISHSLCRQMVAELSGLPDQPPCFGDLSGNLCPTTTDDIIARLKDQYLVMTSWTRPSYR